MLLQLASTNTERLFLIHNELNALLAIEINFIATIIQINNKLQKQILNRYKANE